MERKDLIFMASEAGFGKLLTGDGLPSMWHGADLEMLERFAELVADHERVAAELRCAKTPVLLDGHHGYTALKVQEMMMAAVSMRSNAGAKPLA